MGRAAIGSVLHARQHAAEHRRSRIRRRRLRCHRAVRRERVRRARARCTRAGSERASVRRHWRIDRWLRRRSHLRRRAADRCARRRTRGFADALLVGHDRPAEGRASAGDRSAVRHRRPGRPAPERGDGVRGRTGLPHARAAVSLGAPGLVDERAPKRRDARADGALRRAGVSRRDRPRARVARPVRAHDVRAHVEAVRRRRAPPSTVRASKRWCTPRHRARSK